MDIIYYHVGYSILCYAMLIIVYREPCKRELGYRTPGLHSPVSSRRLPETFGDFCESKTSDQAATCFFRKRATSVPAEGPAYRLDFARRCEFPLYFESA